jgi:hypothetical protein
MVWSTSWSVVLPHPVAIPFLDRRLQPQLDQPQHSNRLE